MRKGWKNTLVCVLLCLYPELPHGQGGCLACCRLQDRIPAVAELHRFILCTRRSGGTAMRVVVATSQLDLPSLTPLSEASCSRLQLGVLHWDTLVDYCKYLIIDITFCRSWFSNEGLLDIERRLLFYFLLVLHCLLPYTMPSKTAVSSGSGGALSWHFSEIILLYKHFWPIDQKFLVRPFCIALFFIMFCLLWSACMFLDHPLWCSTAVCGVSIWCVVQHSGMWC